IAVHMYEGMPWEPYFRAVEEIMNGYAGRPHWGKRHFQTAETLASRYPKWEEFQRVRDQLDPDRLFANDYTQPVLGAWAGGGRGGRGGGAPGSCPPPTTGPATSRRWPGRSAASSPPSRAATRS